MKLSMHAALAKVVREKHPPRPNATTWLVWPVNHGMTAAYPPDDRILAIARETFRAGELEVLKRSSTHNGVYVRIPKGTRPTDREPFLTALGNETT